MPRLTCWFLASTLLAVPLLTLSGCGGQEAERSRVLPVADDGSKAREGSKVPRDVMTSKNIPMH